MKNPEKDFSLIVPTLNEEFYLPLLLQNVHWQKCQPAEIVIVDAMSIDRTLKVAERWQKYLPRMRVFQVERSTIARQRNFGVAQTTAPNLLFMDADTYPAGFDTFREYMEEVERKKPDVAMAENFPLSKISDRLYYKLAFWWLPKIMQRHFPFVTGMNLYLKRKSFEEVGGFDEQIRVGEDIELAQRMIKKGYKLTFLGRPKFINSPRRIREEGILGFSAKILRAYMHVIRQGFYNLPVDYDFGHHRR